MNPSFIILPALAATLLTTACGDSAGETGPAAAEATAATASASSPVATATATTAPAASATASPDAAASASAVPDTAAAPDPKPAASATASTAKPVPVAVAAAEVTPMAAPAAFGTCKACHTVDRGGASGIGPNLHGVVGRKAGSRAGYAYSDAMAGSGLVWTRASLDKFLADPRGTVPGTKMAAPGIADPARRASVIQYLESLK